MKKRFYAALLGMTLVLSSLTGCQGMNVDVNTTTSNVSNEETEAIVEEVSETQADSEQEEVDQAEIDQAAADKVAELIDAIYVQERTEETDAQCVAAKEAWDALTDEQKALVEGEEADPDYFGRDTGDASLDDTLNQDEIGENEVLVVSFGTSFNDSRAKDIGGIEKAIAAAYPDWSVRRAFTAQIIINHVQARENAPIDNMEQALDRAVANGVKNIVIQPTHLMHGAEYDEMKDAVDSYADKFESVEISEPLLGAVGATAEETNDDKKVVAEAVTEEAVKEAGFESLDEAKKAGVAFVFMGHGTSHTAKVSYTQMQNQMLELGYENVWIGTVEGEPEETACENVIEAVSEAGYSKVILRPLMVVAGDHANNDMAGDDDDSWKSMFIASGKFESVDTQISGLGRIERLQQLYIEHLDEIIKKKKLMESNQGIDLEDGSYLVEFDTDSSMFHVNEMMNNKASLTVKAGEGILHLIMPSQNVLNLYSGFAADAENDKENWIEPSIEEVTYDDGISEEVFSFDVPVNVLDEEFDLALIGKKNVWYDHKVIISDPQVVEGTQVSEANDAITDDEAIGTIEVSLEGGTGKAHLTSPTKIVKNTDGYLVTIEWSSKHYDYMIVDGVKYLPIEVGDTSVYEIPITGIDKPLNVIADTVAMSEPHEIEYVITFDANTIK